MKLKLGVIAKKIKLLYLHVRSISSRLWSLTLKQSSSMVIPVMLFPFPTRKWPKNDGAVSNINLKGMFRPVRLSVSPQSSLRIGTGEFG